MYFVDESPGLEHYGRKGMKWYQHIYTDTADAAKKSREAGERYKSLEEERANLSKGLRNRIKNRRRLKEIEKEQQEARDEQNRMTALGKKKIWELMNQLDYDQDLLKRTLGKLMDNPDVMSDDFLYKTGSGNDYTNMREGEELSYNMVEFFGRKAYENKLKRQKKKSR